MPRSEYSPDEFEPVKFGGLIKSLVLPRPIAWVSTISADGVPNLAPHSFYTMASESPAVAQFTSIGHKDSLRNVRETEEFVINLASEPQFELINATATDYPPERDEFEELEVAREASFTVSPPRVKQAPAALECRLRDTIPVGNGVIVLGEVIHVSVRSEYLTEGRPDAAKLKPLARLGGNRWAELGEIREIERVRYRDPACRGR